jgi:hypothetical protein
MTSVYPGPFMPASLAHATTQAAILLKAGTQGFNREALFPGQTPEASIHKNGRECFCDRAAALMLPGCMHCSAGVHR